MRLRRLAQWIGAAGLGFALQACVVRDTTPVNSGYGYGYYGPGYASASVSVELASLSWCVMIPVSRGERPTKILA